MQRRSLGRGLSDLLSGTNAAGSRAVIDLELDRLTPNPYQPRRAFPEAELQELAASLARQGVLQPLLVRETADGYQIVAGERRWRAAQLVELPTVPCLVCAVDEAEMLQVALIENLQREDLNPLEQARAYRRLLEDFDMTQEELAERLGRSRSALANSLRLLALPVEVQEAVVEGTLSEGHARSLLGLKDHPGLLYQICQAVIERDLTVRETEELVKKVSAHGMLPTDGQRAHPERPDPHLAAAAQRIQDALATKVAITRRGKRGGGVIRVHYHDQEELNRLLEALCPPETL